MLGGGRWQFSEVAQQLAAELGSNPRPVLPLSEWLVAYGQQPQQ